MNAVTGVFRSRAAAEEAMHALETQGVAEGSISLLSAESQVVAKGPETKQEKRRPVPPAGRLLRFRSDELLEYAALLKGGKSILIVHPFSDQQASVARFVFEMYEGEKVLEAHGGLRRVA